MAVEKEKVSYKILALRLFLIISLVVGGIFLSKKFNRINKEKKQVLGEETQNKPVSISSELKNLVNKTVDGVSKKADNLINTAINYAENTASQSAEAATDFVIQNTVGNLVKQIDKLPEKQKEEIKKDICK